jgi:proteasome lid subunit RPN8/RPN11
VVLLINKEDEFYIPAKEFMYVKSKYNLVGIYHSHGIGPAEPSEFDIASSEVCCYPFIIYSLPKNEFCVYKPEYSDADATKVKELEEALR